MDCMQGWRAMPSPREFLIFDEDYRSCVMRGNNLVISRKVDDIKKNNDRKKSEDVNNDDDPDKIDDFKKTDDF